MPRGKPTVKSINASLKAGGIPVRINQRGNSLYLRSSKFPPKLGDAAGKQYEIPMGTVSPVLLARIEDDARIAWRLVIEGRWNWSVYGKGARSPKTVGEWVERFEKHYLRENDITPRTFEKHWRAEVLDRLPKDKKLSKAVILTTVLSTPENTRLRKQTCRKLAKFAEFADIEVNLKLYQGNYGLSTVAARTLPTDLELEKWYGRIKSKSWQIIFARLVAFGLRPSEAFFFELIDSRTATVIDAKSKRPREVKAFHPHWADMWELEGELPRITWRQKTKHEDISQRIGTRFNSYGMEFDRYDLRHAWCVRVSVEYEVPLSIAARWAGHSPEVHSRIYERWIRGDQAEQVYRKVTERRDR